MNVFKRRTKAAEQDDFLRGYHDMPDDRALRKLTFVQLVSALQDCEKDSPKAKALERELFRRELRKKIIMTGAVAVLAAMTGALITALLHQRGV